MEPQHQPNPAGQISMTQLPLIPVERCQHIKGMCFPAEIKFGKLLVTGPPGSGKTTFVTQIGGWPEEGYVDLTATRWWAAQSLALRPRELHLGLPFAGFSRGLSVFDPEWMSASPPLELELNRLKLPPPKRLFFSVDWRDRFVFEFLVPDPEVILARRLERARKGTHPVDAELSLGTVRRQVGMYEEVALFMHRHGMAVYLRKDTDQPPLRIAEPTSQTDGANARKAS